MFITNTEKWQVLLMNAPLAPLRFAIEYNSIMQIMQINIQEFLPRAFLRMNICHFKENYIHLPLQLN